MIAASPASPNCLGTRLRLSIVALALVALPACRVTDVPIWTAGHPAESSYSVRTIRDVDYGEALTDEPFRHQLDLYLPRGVKEFPVVVFVHGGAWMIGDNRCCGLYSSVGEFLASHGIAAVLPNYRLSPGVKHPEHIKDVARAFAWTRRHIAEYGGRVDQLFIAGHSAGGHLAALLATDERYLKAEGLSAADIKGVIAISGVYRVPPGKLDVRLGGIDRQSFRFDEIAPFRGDRGGPMTLGLGGVPFRLNVFGPAFGNDPDLREDASPIKHVRSGLPPFAIFHAERDLPMLTLMAEEFYQALREHGCDAQLVRIDGRNHNSIIFMAIEDGDPVGSGMVEFVRRHTLTGP
jgi:acetyl esterase/lipase